MAIKTFSLTAFCAAVALAIGMRALADPPADKKPDAADKKPAASDKPAADAGDAPKLAITISKETTAITEPLDKDGYVDYYAAIDEIAKKDVTPENNASVLLWKVIGPKPVDKAVRKEFFQRLGMPAPSDDGVYFVSLEDFVHQQKDAGELPSESGVPIAILIKKLSDAAGQPWTEKNYPLLARWLAANQTLLAQTVEATKRPRRYDPIVQPKEELISRATLPGVTAARAIGRALVARAMLHVSNGESDDAWSDLLAVHRLARLTCQGPCPLEALTADQLENMAALGDESLFQTLSLSAAEASQMQDDLAKLPPLQKAVDKIDATERYIFLDSVQYMARKGADGIKQVRAAIAHFTHATPPPETDADDAMLDETFKRVDWDAVLRLGNSWEDRIVAAARKPTAKERREAVQKIDEDLKRLPKEPQEWQALAEQPDEDKGAALTEKFGGWLVEKMMSTHWRAPETQDRRAMQLELTKLGFALAAYHADEMKYPAQLADLTPKYVAAIPPDAFSDQDLRYKLDGDGYTLYSVGPNGRDDNGSNTDKPGEADDITVLVANSKQ